MFIITKTGCPQKNYVSYLSNRKNIRRGGSLSINTIKNNLAAIKRFSKYLQKARNINLDMEITIPKEPGITKTILTQEEIRALYLVTDKTLLGFRDRALLAIYYGCGLRRNEGVNLLVNDVLLEKEIIHVRKGKNYKERFVPLTKEVKRHLTEYLDNARQYLLNDQGITFYLLIGIRGDQFSASGAYARIKLLAQRAGITKDLPAGKAGIGLHTLRHSIATHLLQNGMGLEFISHFLGHSSLESTQIYTHLSAEIK